jgi:dTDP-4-amino-4,6-dideoxygalactose transaminase
MLRRSGVKTQPLRLATPSLPPLELYAAELAETWQEGWLSNFGPQARSFEEECAAYAGLPHARAVSNCDVGLALAVRALGLERGTAVIVPSFTFASTLHALLWNGLEPRFADVDPDTWCLTAESAARAIDRDTTAIVGTHAFMAVCDVDGLERLAAESGATLLFDAAQAMASWRGPTHVGRFGHASAFSFSPTKIATCGEGGLAVFRDADAAARFTLLRSYGSDSAYESRFVGLNGKLSELHAALGRLTLAAIEAEVTARLDLVERYRERLGSLPDVQLQAEVAGWRATPTQLVADFGTRRDDVALALGLQGIETRAYFRPLHAMDHFRGFSAGALPVTDRLGGAVLALPLHRGMGEDDVDRVCEAIAGAMR